jgi:hypothetical protein
MSHEIGISRCAFCAVVLGRGSRVRVLLFRSNAGNQNKKGGVFPVAKTLNSWFVVALLKQPMTDKLYFGATMACRFNVQPNTFMRTQFLKRLCAFVCLSFALFGAKPTAIAQIQVGSNGSPTEVFAALPPVLTWSGKSITGAAGFPENDAGMDALVNGSTNAASTINLLLDNVTGDPPGTSTNARWTSSGYVMTRPTGNAVTFLMAKLTNVANATISSFHVQYQFTQKTTGVANEAIKGQRVYYNVTGAAGQWIALGNFGNSFTTNVVQNIDITINVPVTNPWAPNRAFYILFADDNALVNNDGANAIDNFTVTNLAIVGPPIIVTQPAGTTNTPGSTVVLNVNAVGSLPLYYQWFRNGGAITAFSTNSTLTIPNASASDNGTYFVLVSNTFGVVQSSNAAVLLACAGPAEFLTRPSDQSLAAGATLTLNALAGGTAPFRYQWYRNGVALANATNSTYSKPNVQPSDSGLYTVTIDNCAELSSSASAVVSVTAAPYVIVPLTNQIWRYEQSNTDLSVPAWEAPGYADGGWQTGRGVFAFENQAVVNALTNTVLNHFNPDYITRYFRTTFNLTNEPGTIFMVTSNLIDDGMVVYLNGVEAFRYNMPGGNIDHGTEANAANPGGEGTFIISNIPPGLAVLGTNTLAVEVHQSDAGSSDTVFGMEVRVHLIPPTSLVVTSQPQSLVVVESQPATFRFGVQGDPAYYQWYKDGVALPGATVNPLNIPIVTTNNVGSYYAVATNLINSVTSSVVTLSMVTDTNGPVLLEADGTLSNRLVLVIFNERVLESTATTITNYRITNVSGGTLTISSAVVVNGTNVLLTTTTPRFINNNYLLIVNNVRDISALTNVITPNSTMPISFLVPLVSADGGGWDFYNPIQGFPVNEAPNLGTTWKEFDYVYTNAWGIGSSLFWDGIDQDEFPAPTRTRAGQTDTITTYFRTKFQLQGASPGRLQFFLTHIIDDGGVFYLNGTEFFRFNMPQGPVDYLTRPVSTISAITRIGPLPLTLPSYRDGTNVLAFELHQPQPIDPDKAFAAQIDAKVESFTVGPVVIASGPTDQTVIEGQPATFQVMQVGGATFQWQSNNLNIASATNGTYTIPVVTTNMQGSQFRVAVSNATTGTISTNATLRVLVDTNAPTIVRAIFASANSILISFNEVMAAGPANTVTNYMVTNSAGVIAPVSTAVLTNGTNVLLTFASPLSGRYSVVVNNLTDNSSRLNPIIPNTVVTVGADFSISLTSPWKYLIANTNDEIYASFMVPGFNDSAWSGPSNSLFYVEGAALPAAKNTPLVLNSGGNYINTFYFRKELVSPVAINDLVMSLRHVIDDGVILYVNGQEVFRFNMPGGVTTASSQAAGAIGDAALVGPVGITVNLVAGTNVLAAVVHQSGAASSDVVFGMELSGGIPSVVSTPMPVQIVEQPRGRTNIVGSTAFFRVTATGSGPISYQWYRDGVPLVNATNALLVVPNVQTANLTNYVAVVSNLFSSATSVAATLSLSGTQTCASVSWTNLLRIETNGLWANYTNGTTRIALKWTNPATNSCQSNATVILQRAMVVTGPWTNIFTNVFGTATVTNTFTGKDAFYRLTVP